MDHEWITLLAVYTDVLQLTASPGCMLCPVLSTAASAGNATRETIISTLDFIGHEPFVVEGAVKMPFEFTLNSRTVKVRIVRVVLISLLFRSGLELMSKCLEAFLPSPIDKLILHSCN